MTELEELNIYYKYVGCAQQFKEKHEYNKNEMKGIILYYILLFYFILLRERHSTSRGRAETEGDTESEADSRLQALSMEPNAGLELTNGEIMTQAKVRCPND